MNLKVTSLNPPLLLCLIASTCSSCLDSRVHLRQRRGKHRRQTGGLARSARLTSKLLTPRRLPPHQRCDRVTAPPADGQQPDASNLNGDSVTVRQPHPIALASPSPPPLTHRCQGDLHPAPPSPSLTPTASTWHGSGLPGHPAPPRRIKTQRKSRRPEPRSC